jgi:hypothetical protein
MAPVEFELFAMVDEAIPPLFEFGECVPPDDGRAVVDGDCFEHDGCRPIFATRLE